MTNCYTEACTCISAYRSSYSGKHKAFLIRATDFADLISAYGNNLDGVRLYIGLDNADFEGFLVGVVKDGSGNFNDVNVANATIKARPCPQMCDTSGSQFA